jgi:putative membrane protein
MTALAHGWHGYGPHMGFGFWGWLYPLLLVALLVLGAYLVARALAPRREDKALEIPAGALRPGEDRQGDL